MNQTQNVAMISGASRGIGLAIARALLGRGCRLSLGVREPRSVPADLVGSDDVLVCRYEARDRHAARAFVDETVAWSGRLDILVNNAGIAPFVGIEDGTDAALDDLFEVNVKAPFRVIQAALPHLKASGKGRLL